MELKYNIIVASDACMKGAILFVLRKHVSSYWFCQRTRLLIGSANARAFSLVLPTHTPYWFCEHVSYWFCQRTRLLIGSANTRAFIFVLRTHALSYWFCKRTCLLIVGFANTRAILLVLPTHLPFCWFCERTRLLIGFLNMFTRRCVQFYVDFLGKQILLHS